MFDARSFTAACKDGSSTLKCVALVCFLTAACKVVNAAKSYVVSGAVAACERLLSTGQELLNQGKGEDALAAFEAALLELTGWGAMLLDYQQRNLLRCQINTEAARALLFGSHRIKEARQYAVQAMSAAEHCAVADKQLLLPAAKRMLLDVSLASSTECARCKKWEEAFSEAEGAVKLAADANEEARVHEVREVARHGRFVELIETSAAALRRKDWQVAEENADAAHRLASVPDERERAAASCGKTRHL